MPSPEHELRDIADRIVECDTFSLQAVCEAQARHSWASDRLHHDPDCEKWCYLKIAGAVEIQIFK